MIEREEAMRRFGWRINSHGEWSLPAGVYFIKESEFKVRRFRDAMLKDTLEYVTRIDDGVNSVYKNRYR